MLAKHYNKTKQDTHQLRGQTSLSSLWPKNTSDTFKPYRIRVFTNRPLRQAFKSHDKMPRMAKLSRDLGIHHIECLPRVSIKGQVITGFLVKLPVDETTQSPYIPNDDKPNLQILHVDGSNSLHESGVGIVLPSPEGTQIEYNIQLNFNTSNNKAEYEDLISGLQIRVYIDSQLMVNQNLGDNATRVANIVKFLDMVKSLTQWFQHLHITHLLQDDNHHTDSLAFLESKVDTFSQ